MQAEFNRKEVAIRTDEAVVEKTITLPEEEYEYFKDN
jgi:hypothetical protein